MKFDQTFLDLLESFSYKANISWSTARQFHDEKFISGKFSIDDEDYRINIQQVKADGRSKERNGELTIEWVYLVGFSRIVDDQEVSKLTDSKFSSKVLGAVYNGILDGIDWDKDKRPDMIVFAAKYVAGDTPENFQKRSDFYGLISQRLKPRIPYSYIQEKLKATSGDAFIFVRDEIHLTKTEINSVLDKIKHF